MSTLVITEAEATGPHFFLDQYVERWWTRVMGPTAMLLGRIIVFDLDCTVDRAIELDVTNTCWQLGNISQRSFDQALRRLMSFGPMRTTTFGFTIPAFIAPVPARHQKMWDDLHVAAHEQELEALGLTRSVSRVL